MRRRLLPLFLALLLLLPFAANAAGITVEPAGNVTQAQLNAALGSVSDLYVTACGEAPNIILSVTWHDNAKDRDMEMCLTGLGAVPSSAQIRTMIACIQRGEMFELTANTRGLLTDAEKRSGLLPDDYYSTLDLAPEDHLFCPGDSLLCWAATAANMLYMSGWAGKAVNPFTNRTYATEDEVFYTFIWSRTNNLGNTEDGIRWFLNGEHYIMPDTDPYTGGTGGSCYPADFVPEEDPQEDDEPDETREDLGNRLPDAGFITGTIGIYDQALAPERIMPKLELMKKGYSAGLSVGLCYYSAPEKKDPDADKETWARYSEQNRRYEKTESIRPDLKYVTDYIYFAFTDKDDCVPVLREGDTYYYPDGSVCPDVSVCKGQLYKDPETGRNLVLSSEEHFMDDPEYFIFRKQTPVDENDLITDRAEWIEGSRHAVTCKGYVADLSNPEEPVFAVFVSDSDDSADLKSYTPENYSREDRPDRVRLHYTIYSRDENGRPALFMDRFYDSRRAKLLGITWLSGSEPLPDPVPVPQTGDAAPGPVLWTVLTAAALCSLAACAVIRRKTRTV